MSTQRDTPSLSPRPHDQLAGGWRGGEAALLLAAAWPALRRCWWCWWCWCACRAARAGVGREGGGGPRGMAAQGAAAALGSGRARAGVGGVMGVGAGRGGRGLARRLERGMTLTSGERKSVCVPGKRACSLAHVRGRSTRRPLRWSSATERQSVRE